uniref:Poly [ADP-ribose] polymerase n=1 Tax=Denticeps clupeoides TaxID=299321 RepID=A0AAY4B6R5_9TELE
FNSPPFFFSPFVNRILPPACLQMKVCFKIGGIRIYVKKGDITQETVKGIVNSTNSDMSLRNGVSGVIFNAAGPSVEQETKTCVWVLEPLCNQPSDGVVLTKAGNLATKNIVHMVGQTKEKCITSAMYKVLKLCEDNKIQSVSFPAFGTGRPAPTVPDSFPVAPLPGCGTHNVGVVRFRRSCLPTAIQRIQSRSQWHRYAVWKQTVDKRHPNQENQRYLYHGTTKDIAQRISMHGFNRSFCGRNATVHGAGTYFAKEAHYSCHDNYSNPDTNGLKYIYRARVLTGSPCKSRRDMKEPDPLDPSNPQAGLYDCAVDNLKNPFIFVVFCDAGAYPDYLITFKGV